MRILAIDPGLRVCGVAELVDGVLARAVLVVSPEKTARGGPAWVAMARAVTAAVSSWGAPCVLVVECPQQYDAAHCRVDRADLSELSAVAGALCAVLGTGEVRTPAPRTWKGQVPKDVHNARTLARLTPGELACVVWPTALGLRHNVTDAIGLGLWASRRGLPDN